VQTSVTYFTDPDKVTAQPGDLLLCATTGPVGKMIRGVTRSWANHACVVVRVNGTQVIVSQEVPHGDVFSPASKLKANKIAVVHVEMADSQRAAAIAFADWVVTKRYGFPSLVSDLFNAAFHTQTSIGIGSRMVCSTASTRAMERSDYIPTKAPGAMTPADLTRDFGCVSWPSSSPPS
jgi:hypothetical protein